LTDHDSIESHYFISKVPEFIIIPGIEVSSSDGHILALGVRELIPSGLTAEETVDRIHQIGGLAIAAHVMRSSKNTIQKDLLRNLRLDALETVNSGALLSRSFRSSRGFAQEIGRPETAGSDAHVLGTVGRAFSEVDCEAPSTENILKAVKEGRTLPQGQTDLWANRLKKISLKLRKKLGVYASSSSI
ncbi:MAG: PHP-associated domain-containing protein, partial [Candidatus Bathyarchaeia archaeon]